MTGEIIRNQCGEEKSKRRVEEIFREILNVQQCFFFFFLPSVYFLSQGLEVSVTVV